MLSKEGRLPGARSSFAVRDQSFQVYLHARKAALRGVVGASVSADTPLMFADWVAESNAC